MENIRERVENNEKKLFSQYAQLSCQSKGRKVSEEQDSIRTCFAIDRDRIIHSFSFRKEKDKTQVFILPNDDHCMNRLTHTLEVTQIAKTIALALSLNETLAEAIALAHDTAHTCFGHAGERALNDIYSGGYIHANEVSRRMNILENKNLSFEVIDGAVNHSGLTNHPRALTLEGQIIPFADKIAYLTSDIENAIEMGIIKDIPDFVKNNLGKKKGEIITTLVTSIINNSIDKDFISMDDETYKHLVDFRNFAYDEIYYSKQLQEENQKAENIIKNLYMHYFKHPQDIKEFSDKNDLERSIVDYIAGMTDTYALNEFEKYFSIRHNWM